MALSWITAADLATPGHALAGTAAESASWILYRLSGEKYGGVRTVSEWYGYDHAACWDSQTCANGVWSASSAHIHQTVGRSRPTPKLQLRRRPAHSIQRITDHSGDLDPSVYQLANNRYVVRNDGRCWNFDQGVEIEYTYGMNPPAAGREAAIALADQLLLGYIGSEECRLPDRVTSVSRQGLSITVLDPQDFLKDGRTGIYEVDLFLSVANPYGARKRARVFIPDSPRGETRS